MKDYNGEFKNTQVVSKDSSSGRLCYQFIVAALLATVYRSFRERFLFKGIYLNQMLPPAVKVVWDIGTLPSQLRHRSGPRHWLFLPVLPHPQNKNSRHILHQPVRGPPLLQHPPTRLLVLHQVRYRPGRSVSPHDNRAGMLTANIRYFCCRYALRP
jgi:hypothetical protein